MAEGSGGTIKEFLIGLGFKVDEAGLKMFEGVVGSASASVLALGSAAIAAAGAVVAGITHIAAEYNELDLLSQRFRSAAEEVDSFRDAAEVIGIGSEVAVDSLKNLDRGIADTALGIGRAKIVFKEIGLQVLDSAGKMRPTVEVMQELAEKLKGMERGKALKVMERLGIDESMLLLFNSDLGTLEKQIQDIEKAAGFNLDDAVEQSKKYTASWREFKAELNRIKMVFDKMIEGIAVRMMPRLRMQIEAITRKFSDWRQTIMKYMPDIIRGIEPLLKIIMGVAETFVIMAGYVARAAGQVLSWIWQINDATDGWLKYIVAAAAAWQLLNGTFLATPLGAIIAGVIALTAAIALLVDDFETWKEGGKSFIDWSKWEPAINSAINALKAMRDIASDLFTMLFDSIGALVKLITGDFSGAWEDIKNWFSTLLDMGGNVAEMFTGIGRAIGFGAGALSTPSPAAAANMAGGNQQSINQDTKIIVQGAGDPQATARAVAGAQAGVNAQMARNARGAVR